MDFDWNLDAKAEGAGRVGKDDGFPIYDYTSNFILQTLEKSRKYLIVNDKNHRIPNFLQKGVPVPGRDGVNDQSTALSIWALINNGHHKIQVTIFGKMWTVEAP